MEIKKGEKLIRDLLTDPCEFEKQGRAYQLLQEYFRGLELDTLRPLLQHEDEAVRRAAVFIASELGSAGEPVMDEVADLVSDPDPRIRWDALESLMACSNSTRNEYIWLVPKALEDANDSIRRLAMRLLCNASNSQLEMALKRFDRIAPTPRVHEQGLSALLRDNGKLGCGEIDELLDSGDSTLSMYGAVAARRLSELYPSILERATKHSNPDVARFAAEARE